MINHNEEYRFTDVIDVGVPGLSARVSISQGILWQSSAGFIDIELKKPVDEKDMFGIGSITKVFVAVVILQLVDELKLDLMETLEDLLAPQIYRGIQNASKATIFFGSGMWRKERWGLVTIRWSLCGDLWYKLDSWNKVVPRMSRLGDSC